MCHDSSARTAQVTSFPCSSRTFRLAVSCKKPKGSGRPKLTISSAKSLARPKSVISISSNLEELVQPCAKGTARIDSALFLMNNRRELPERVMIKSTVFLISELHFRSKPYARCLQAIRYHKCASVPEVGSAPVHNQSIHLQSQETGNRSRRVRY